MTKLTSKKGNRMFKLVTSIALIMALWVTMALPATAAVYSEGTDSENPAKAAVTKLFKLPVNTTTPESKFVFTFAKVGMLEGVGVDESADLKDKMPSIQDLNINYDPGERPTGTDGMTYLDGDTYTLVKQSDDFIKNLTPAGWGNGEGVYVYKLYENSTPGNSEIKITDDENEWDVYSEAEYDVEIWVEKDDKGILFVRYVSVKIVTEKTDEYYTIKGKPGDGKVDPTPDGQGENELIDRLIEEDFSQVFFTNKYWKNDGGGPTDTKNTSLEIIKKIKGAGAVKTTRFEFDVTVIQPSIIPDTLQYRAVILDKDGANVTSTDHYSTISNDTYGDYIKFTSNSELKIKLTDEERLSFLDLTVGATVKVNEAASNDYIPSYLNTFPSDAEKEYKGEVKKELGFPSADDPGLHYIREGANVNYSNFTNTRSGATPTGVSVDDLPYLALIGLTLASLGLYLSVKFRKKVTNNA
ncbi:MAG: hypothetical protein FWH52_01855 [Synergistaceae bacterium]|nr:hypothetical protein [Synergistaceae bacterium]